VTDEEWTKKIDTVRKRAVEVSEQSIKVLQSKHKTPTGLTRIVGKMIYKGEPESQATVKSEVEDGIKVLVDDLPDSQRKYKDYAQLADVNDE
jgi:hypothetical protein